MDARHARRIVIVAALVAIGVAAAAGWASRGLLIEEWLICRFEKGSEEEREKAIQALIV